MNITLYTTHCPRCKVVELKLKSKNIDYETCENIEEIQKLGVKSAPVLKVDNDILDFSAAINWINTRS